MSSSSVTMQIQNGTPVSVPWTQGMTVQQALEGLFNQQTTYGAFTFSLSYAGGLLGYYVTVINGIVDTSPSSAPSGPYFFWVVNVNGKTSNVGVNITPLSAGDAVSFQFQQYTPAAATKKSAGGIKHGLLTKAGQKLKK